MTSTWWDLFKRDAIADIKNAPQTFSSWHACMQKTYCKWPTIVGIIIASVVVISVIWCCARCLCCGLSCCCSCFSCCDRCGGRRQERGRYADRPPSFTPAPYHGYQPAPPAPPAHEPPRFATFDAPTQGGGKMLHEDSLPAMPSWGKATSKRVEDHSIDHSDLEMGHLGTHPQRITPGLGLSAAQRNSGGNYMQVSPQSPATAYAQGHYNGDQMTHSYGSDHGAQNLSPTAQDTGYAGYSSPFPNVAHSPSEPTSYNAEPYDAHSPVLNQGPSSFSPIPQSSGGYYSPSVSTRYEPTEYQAPSMNYTSPAQQRPPSLLQIGRRPVQGSAREI